MCASAAAFGAEQAIGADGDVLEAQQAAALTVHRRHARAGQARRIRVDDEERETGRVALGARRARDDDDVVGRMAVQHPDLLAGDREAGAAALGRVAHSCRW